MDATSAPPAPSLSRYAPVCAICTRDLTALTPAARLEHANRCADSSLPLGGVSRRPRTRPRSGATGTPRKEKNGDARVRRLLDLLGLARYADRFAQEEVDLVALRLLDDDDFAQLRIPDAARRRIAEAMHSVPILAQIQAEARSEREEDGEMEDAGEDEVLLPTQKFPESKLGQTMRRRQPLLADESSDGEVYRPVPASTGLESADVRKGGVTSSPSRGRDGIYESSPLHRGKEKFASPVALPKRNKPHSPFKRNATQSPMKRSASGSSFSGSKDNAPLSPNVRFADGANFNSIACAPESNSPALPGEAPQGWATNGALSSSSEHDGECSDVSSLRNFECEFHGASQISLRTKLDGWRRKQIRREKQKHKREIERERKRHKTEIEKIQARYKEMQKRVEAGPDPASNVQPLREEPVAAAASDDVIDLTAHISSGDEDKIEKVFTPHAQQKKFPNAQVKECIVISSTRKNRTPSWFSDASIDIPQLKESPKQATSREESVDRQPEAGLFMSSEEEVMDLTCPEGEPTTMPFAMPEDENTRQSSAGFGEDKDIDKDGEALSKSGTDRQSQAEDAPVESRLKKRPKKVATREEILTAIRDDTALYDDILFMHTVPFEKVFESVKSSGVKVSKLALNDVLRKEGIAFKAEPRQNGERGKAYFRRLALEYD